MAYLALYRKWRPTVFTEVIGQKHIAIPLERALSEGRLAHAYLFSGPRGTGKTSMARILAKAVNCLSPDGVNPCNHCQNCQDINNGASLDVYEIDAASNRGIDDIRALRDSVRTLPASSKKKVYIIDEVHMLSKEAFNALLKTLEEPPAHVLFILATTDPQKIPVTILSRCQSYEFHRISTADISEHLMHVASETGFSLDKEAADLIAVKAEGGLRDALSMLDKCFSSISSREVTASLVYDILGLTEKKDLIQLADYIFSHEKGKTLTVFYDLLSQGKDALSILAELQSYFRDIMIYKINPQADELISYGNELPLLKKAAESVDSDYLDMLFSELAHIYQEAKTSSSVRMSAEMGLLRLSRYDSSMTIPMLARRIKELESRLEGTPIVRTAPASKPAPAAPAAPVTPVSPRKPEPITAPASPVPPPVHSLKTLEVSPVSSSSQQVTASAHTVAAAESPSASDEAADADLLAPSSYPGIWQGILDYVMKKPRIDVYSCFQKGKLIYAGKNRAIISVPQQFLVLAGNNKSYQKVISDAFKALTGTAYIPKTVLAGTGEEAEALAMAASNPSEPAKAASQEVSTKKEEYRKISKSEIPEKDKEEHALSEALKFIPDCDIYEKIDD